MKAVEEAQQRLVDHRVMTDVAGELVELLRGRQLPEQQQVGDLHEGALLRQLLDRVAAVQQHPGIAIDVGDLAFGRGGHAEAGIEGEDARFLVDPGDVERGRPDRAACAPAAVRCDRGPGR